MFGEGCAARGPWGAFALRQKSSIFLISGFNSLSSPCKMQSFGHWYRAPQHRPEASQARRAVPTRAECGAHAGGEPGRARAEPPTPGALLSCCPKSSSL